MAGFDARTPLSIKEDPLQFAGSLQADLRGKKVAWLGDFNGYLPMGMQIMGPATQDLSVLQMAHAYEQASGWTKRMPPANP